MWTQCFLFHVHSTSHKVSLCFTVVLLTTTRTCNSSLFMKSFIFCITVNQKFLSAINISELHINLIQLPIFFKQCFTNCSPSVPSHCKRKTISVTFYLLHHSQIYFQSDYYHWILDDIITLSKYSLGIHSRTQKMISSLFASLVISHCYRF